MEKAAVPKESDTFEHDISKLIQLHEMNEQNVYPSKLKDILSEINKIETRFNLRPRQLESVIQFHLMALELHRILSER